MLYDKLFGAVLSGVAHFIGVVLGALLKKASAEGAFKPAFVFGEGRPIGDARSAAAAMLSIKTAQMRALEGVAVRAFEDRTYRHLEQFFAGHCALLGERQLRRIIQFGWAKAKSYDLTAECCVRTYIEFMCLLGGHFDEDPILPWAAEILNDRACEQIARGDRLYDRAYEYIRHLVPDYRDITGKPITQRFVGALRELRMQPDAPISLELLPGFSSALLRRLQAVFPAKCAYVGEEAVAKLIVSCLATAASYGIRGERGLTLFSTLTFVLGRGFHHDLLLPWAAGTLNDRTLRDEKQKVDRLFVEGVGFLRTWWKAAHGHEA